MKKINFSKVVMVLIITVLVANIVRGFFTEPRYDLVSEAEVMEMINASEETSVMYADGAFTVKTSNGTVQVEPSNVYEFRQTMFEKGLDVEEVDVSRPSLLAEILSLIITISICVVIINVINFFIDMGKISKSIKGSINNGPTDGNAGNKDPFNFAKMTGQPNMSLNINKEVPKVKFSDVAGIDEVEREVKSVVSFLKNPYKYQMMGARMPKGAILYGNPGTGKTLIAKAIAGEAGVPFLSVSGSDFMQMYVGVGAMRVRELFDNARKVAPCIIFIDEIDAIAAKRGSSNTSERDQTINAILTEMDGFAGSEGIFVLAATNRLDILDPAILRAGRFDKHIAVPLPDLDARTAILNLHARNKKFDETVNISNIAKQTVGFAGADLENLLNEASIIAVDKGKTFVSAEEIDRAFFKVVMQGDVKDGQSKRGKKELELVAWHEAGHTLITKLLTKDDVTRVTILSSTSGAGGVTFHTPREGEFYSKQDLKNRIAISYGGRAAEEILFGDHDHVTVGASSDIQSASKAIRDYIMKYGMSEKFGMLDISAFDYQSMSNEDLVNEAAELANDIYKYTYQTLLNNRDKLQALAEALLENESLFDTDINRILGISNPEEVETTDDVVEAIV